MKKNIAIQMGLVVASLLILLYMTFFPPAAVEIPTPLEFSDSGDGEYVDNAPVDPTEGVPAPESKTEKKPIEAQEQGDGTGSVEGSPGPGVEESGSKATETQVAVTPAPAASSAQPVVPETSYNPATPAAEPRPSVRAPRRTPRPAGRNESNY